VPKGVALRSGSPRSLRGGANDDYSDTICGGERMGGKSLATSRLLSLAATVAVYVVADLAATSLSLYIGNPLPTRCALHRTVCLGFAGFEIQLPLVT
jgi:hypothetical protein